MRPSLLKMRIAADAGLAAHVANDLVERLAVVVQHLVAGAAQDHVGDAVRGLNQEFLGSAALHAQVDVAEERRR